MEEVSKQEGRTVLLVSHNLGSVMQLCSSAILLHKGNLVMQGETEAVIERYLLSDTMASDIRNRRLKPDQLLCVESVTMANTQGGNSSEFKFDEDIFVDVKISAADSDVKLNQYKLLITVLDASKHKITSAETLLVSESVRLKIPSQFLTRGQYSLSFIIYIPGVAQFDKIEDSVPFSIIDTGSEFYHLEGFNYGVVFGNFLWEFN